MFSFLLIKFLFC